MAVRTANTFAEPLRTLFRVGVVGGLSDGQLLDRFATGHREDAESAFRALMDRHGPMVLRACRVVLDDPHDAEDAFQATFLILARQAGTIRDRGSVASWLHRIAWRIAAHMRAAAARRREIERQVARPAVQPSVDPERLILDTILHEELIRLPEKYRKPIVLCYLEGLTHEGAAAQLGWPVGTVRGRLARARDLLRARLTRRGVTSPAIVAPVGWFPATSAAEAVVPSALLDTTVESVLKMTSGQTIASVVSARIAMLMEGAPKVIALSRWKIVAGLLFLVGAIGIGSGLSMGRSAAMPQQSAEAELEPKSPSPNGQATIPKKQTANPIADGKPPGSQPEAQARRDVVFEGTVVDDQGKPAADAQILFHAPAPYGGKVASVEVGSRTNAAGRFSLTTPPLEEVNAQFARVWAYHSGSVITARAGVWFQPTLVLRKPEPKSVTIEGPDGQPIVGARVYPRVIFITDGAAEVVPEILAAPRSVVTGADGRATVNYLAGRDKLAVVRITADPIGTQDFQLVQRPGRDNQGAAIVIRLKPTSRLIGRIQNRAGQPVGNQTVEVWSREGPVIPSTPVEFKNGPLRTAADGSFQTPDNLLAGSSYRVVVRAPGMQPILSEWITIEDKPRVLLPMIQRPLRTISGRVVDRQGRPVRGVEVFQSGDGPARTATRTDANGRFTLGGFMTQGPVFLFVRGQGFRFFGRLIKPSDEPNITVDLTRSTERPGREMRMLADPIPLEQSQILARRLLMDPYWQAVEKQNDNEKIRVLGLLTRVDPVGVLGKLEDVEFPNANAKSSILAAVARRLAPIDPFRAAALAESIEVPSALRFSALLGAADALPERERNRKLALLDSATVQAKLVPPPLARFNMIGIAAEHWYEVGEKEKAKALFAEGLRLANQIPGKTDGRRGDFAARLARVDLPRSLAIANDFPVEESPGGVWKGRVLRNIAYRLATDNPAEAERILRQVPPVTVHDWLPPAIAWKMATVDPARAQRLTAESQRFRDHPQLSLFLALGLKSRDQVAAVQAFQMAMHGIDRLMKDGAEYSQMLELRHVLLPLVEQIDPALVPEYFWRVVATRPSIGNPQSSADHLSGAKLVALLAWYDRDVAVALFEPVRAAMEQTDDRELAGWGYEFLAWSIFDPRAAVARLEKVPIDPKLEVNSDFARDFVSEMLGVPRETRSRRVWFNLSDMQLFFDPGQVF